MEHDGWVAVGAQFGAGMDMLERAITACPDPLWGDRSRTPEYWYTVFHVLFWLDLYLSETRAGFAPPPPFGLEELDPAGVLPPRVYTRDELLAYLSHCRTKCATRLASHAGPPTFRLSSVELPIGELHLYNLRHLQHHVGQLYLILRQVTDATPGWVSRGAEAPAPTGGAMTVEAVDHAGVFVPPPLIFTLVFLIGVGLQYVVPLPRWPTTAIHPLMVMVAALGLLLAIWSLTRFRAAHTSPIPIRPALPRGRRLGRARVAAPAPAGADARGRRARDPPRGALSRREIRRAVPCVPRPCAPLGVNPLGSVDRQTR
jgi:hypothetical protein